MSKKKESRRPRKNSAKRRIAFLKNKMNCGFFVMADFFDACPVPLAELKKKNNAPLYSQWRSVGMVWMLLSGKSSVEAAETFGRNHSTAFHSLGNVERAMEGFDTKLREKIEAVSNVSNEVGFARKMFKPTRSARVIILERRKRIDPRKRIWKADDKYHIRTTFLARMDWDFEIQMQKEKRIERYASFGNDYR